MLYNRIEQPFRFTKKKLKVEFANLGLQNTGIFFYNKTDSTNKRAKLYAKRAKTALQSVFVAKCQSAGRGRGEHTFESRSESGLWFSLLLYPKKGVKPSDLTGYAAVKICSAIKSFYTEDESPDIKIKWVNDLYLGEKKLSGILTEGEFGEDGELSYAVIGIGINLYKTEYPDSIRDIATDLESETGKKICREALLARITSSILSDIDRVGTLSVVDEYRKSSIMIGKSITVMRGGESFGATVMAIDDNFALLVLRDDGKTELLTSAEVSTKIKSNEQREEKEMPFGIKDHHKDLSTLHVGCERPHAYFIPFKSEKEAAVGVRNSSSYFKSLIGAWNFKFYESVNLADDPRVDEIEYTEKMDVPSNWQYHIGKGYDIPQYTNSNYPFPNDVPNVPTKNPCALYSRDVNLSAKELLDKDVMLTFEGVDSCFYLFVNKQYVGYSQVSHATSEFNVTSFVHEGKNEITVLVLKWCDGSYVEDQDMYRASGIFREVFFLMRDKARIEDIFVKNPLADDFSSADLKVEFRTNAAIDISATLTDKDGAKIAAASVSGENSTLDFGKISSPKLWSDEDPYLYDLTIRSGSEIIVIPVGFRRVEIKDKAILINGKKVKAKGVNRHDSNPILGHSTPMEHILRDIKLLKSFNVNMVRTSHYPNDPRFYELCDRYGLFVCDEADIECHGINIYRETNEIVSTPEWTAAFLDRAERMLERDKNHPSIIMWSVGNESGAGRNHKAMIDYFKERDNSRLVHAEDESRIAFRIDELRREGKYNNTDPAFFRSYIDFESRMYPAPNIIENEYLLPGKSDKPFFLCEYCHAMGVGPGGLDAYIDLFYKYDSFFGGCIWEFTDHSVAVGDYRYASPKFIYGGDMGEYPHDSNFCVDGLVYPDRRPHTGFYEVKEAYRPFVLDYADGVLKVKSRRYFKSLSDLSLYYTVERNGKPIASGSLGALDILPGEEKSYELPIDKKEFTTLNISICQNTATDWADIGHEVGAVQFIISDEISGSDAQKGGATLAETRTHYEITFGENIVKIGKFSGLIESIVSDGKSLITAPVTPTVWRAPIDNDRIIKTDWFKYRLDKLAPDFRDISAEVLDDSVVVKAKINLATAPQKPSLLMEVTYTFSEGRGIGIGVKAEVDKQLPALPRFGFVFTMPEEAEQVRYFGYGPRESYEDMKLSSRISLFRTTATENFEHYVRPQSNSSHHGCKWADVTTAYGQGLYFSADNFALSVSHFTQQQLTETEHDYELVPNKETTVIIDYRTEGIGSNSCGPAPEPKYTITEKEIAFSFNVKALFTGNVCPFDEYLK